MTSYRIQFTKPILTNIKPPEGSTRDHYYDITEKGLVLQVTRSGTKSFYLCKRIEGKPERVLLGAFPDISVENARKTASKTKGKIADGQNPQKDKRKIKAEITFVEMFEQFMERYSKKEKRSWKDDEREVNKFLSHWFKRKASTISKQEIQKLHERIRDNNGLYQANRVFERIRAIYNKTIEWGWEGANPTRGIKKFKETSRDRFLQANELPCFFQALAEEQNLIARDYILISLLTGARKSNVLAMRWNDINFDNRTWRIPETKNGDPVTVPLIEQAIEILRQRKKLNVGIAAGSSPYVFPGSGAKGHLADPKKSWKRLCQNATVKLWQQDTEFAVLVRKAQRSLTEEYSIIQLYKIAKQLADKENLELPTGLTDIRIHDLRRTLGSWQAATGATTAIIGKSLGHKSQQATAIYERLNIDPVRASVERATNAMLTAMNKQVGANE